MTTEDIIIQIFCLVDDQMQEIKKHPQAKLYPSELVIISILFSLKSGFFRPFYRWLNRDYGDLFGNGSLPYRTPYSVYWKSIKIGVISYLQSLLSLRLLIAIQLN